MRSASLFRRIPPLCSALRGSLIQQHHGVEALAAEEAAVERDVTGSAQSSGRKTSRSAPSSRAIFVQRCLDRRGQPQQQMVDEPFTLARQRLMQHFIIGQRGQQVIEGTEQIVGNAGIADGHVARAKQSTCQLQVSWFSVAARPREGKSRAPSVRATGQPSGFRMQAPDNAAENSLAGSTGGVSSLC